MPRTFSVLGIQFLPFTQVFNDSTKQTSVYKKGMSKVWSPILITSNEKSRNVNVQRGGGI